MCLRGDIYYANLNNTIGNVQSGVRPVVIVSNNFYNNHSNNVQIVPISTNTSKIMLTHVMINDKEVMEDCGLVRCSKAQCEQVMTISKEQLYQRIGHAPKNIKNGINKALSIQLGM